MARTKRLNNDYLPTAIATLVAVCLSWMLPGDAPADGDRTERQRVANSQPMTPQEFSEMVSRECQEDTGLSN